MAKTKRNPKVTPADTVGSTNQSDKESTLVWTLVSLVVATFGAAVARRLVNSIWRTATG